VNDGVGAVELHAGDFQLATRGLELLAQCPQLRQDAGGRERRRLIFRRGAAGPASQASDTLDELLRDKNVRDTAAGALDLIHFKYGQVLLEAGYHGRAAKEFLAATRVERAEAGLVTMAHLYAARAYDAGGKRDQALAQYKVVLARPNVYDAHDEAKRGLKQPFKGEQAGAGKTGAGASLQEQETHTLSLSFAPAN
jgi:hypothetical protein